MIKIYYPPPAYRLTREYMLIKQGIINNPRVELVSSEKESDFVFLFYYVKKRSRKSPLYNFPYHKIVFIDYHDNPNWMSPIKCLAYFKRSWTEMVEKENYTVRKLVPKPSNVYPLTFAIMDEFIVKGDMERDVTLSCTLRTGRRGHLNRDRILALLKGMKIQGNTQIGQLNKGSMKRFNEPDMKEYFRLLKRSQIVVTCNPGRWEGDHRIWEAFANGALVFIDKTYFPLIHPFVDGEHCIFYEPSDQGLSELREKILFYLKNIATAAYVAKTGHDFAMKYHRTSNRIDEILEVIL